MAADDKSNIKNFTYWIPINRIYWNFFAIHKHSFRNYRSYTTKEIKLERKQRRFKIPILRAVGKKGIKLTVSCPDLNNKSTGENWSFEIFKFFYLHQLKWIFNTSS